MELIYTAPNAEIGFQKLSDLAGQWNGKYSYISRSWPNNWEQPPTFRSYPDEIRSLIYTINLIENFNRCLRKVAQNHSSFLDENALIKSLFPDIQPLQRKLTSKIPNWGVIPSLGSRFYIQRVFEYLGAEVM